MSPQTGKYEEQLHGDPEDKLEKLVAPSADNWRFELSDPPHFLFFMWYVASGFYGAYVCITTAKLATVIFALLLVYPCLLGVTAGVHRLWTHRAYKAKAPLEIFLVFLYILANQRSIVHWVQMHRLHHKYSDTDADPHNATRGFFFSHFWYLAVKRHPEAQKREKQIDVSDLMNNPIVRFQEKYYVPLTLAIAFFLPSLVPMLWGESFAVAYHANMFRLNLALQLTNCINSVAHLVGYKPIDRTVPGTQYRFLGAFIIGEGFHNYHHTFPQDYRASEFGYLKLNLTARFIDFMARIGQAYDLKTTSEDVVRARVLQKGDGSDIFYLPYESSIQAPNKEIGKLFCKK